MKPFPFYLPNLTRTRFMLSAVLGLCLILALGSFGLGFSKDSEDSEEPLSFSELESSKEDVTKASENHENGPVLITMIPQRQIFSRREGLMVSFIFKALEPARICFETDPMTQFKFKIIRSGQGELNLAPLVVRDTRLLFGKRPKIFHLEAGDQHTYRLNLKRIHFLGGEKWIPGDYSVEASFRLCEQREGNDWDESDKETPVKIVRHARFMIMN